MCHPAGCSNNTLGVFQVIDCFVCFGLGVSQSDCAKASMSSPISKSPEGGQEFRIFGSENSNLNMYYAAKTYLLWLPTQAQVRLRVQTRLKMRGKTRMKREY